MDSVSQPHLPLIGKVAAVTGGAYGIGLASTRAPLYAGARVVEVDGNVGALQALRGEVGDVVVTSSLAVHCPTPWDPVSAKAAGGLLDPHEAVMFMQSRSHGMTIRDVVMMPTNFEL